MSTPVTMTYLEFHDSGRNSHKFYASFVFGSYYFFQWGRVGADGQFSRLTTSISGSFTALRAAHDKLDAKLGEGYQHLGQHDFTVILPTGFSGTKVELQLIANAGHSKRRQDNAGLTPTPAAPAPAAPSTLVQPSTADQLTAFHERALATLGLAVTDPDRALIQYAVLREEFAELQSQMDRAASYLQTLDQFLIGAAA